MKVAVVTGAGRGIGLAIARRLSADGYAVMLNDRDGERLEQARSLLAKSNLDIAACQGDISSASDVHQLFDAVRQQYGRLDVCVCNAGIAPKHNGASKPAIDMPDAEWDEVIRVNLTGTFMTARAAAAMMDRALGGSIVLVASLAGRRYVSHVGAHYHATKSGVIGLAHALAGEWAERGIRVNSVAPGLVRTELANATSPELRDRFMAGVPLQQWGEPEDVAGAVSFLVGSDSRYVTGATLDVNGGAWMS
jgi:3-oxoacyl-[acyl-carrier protein] reductase